MICSLIGFVFIYAGFYALIGGIALKLAYKTVFHEYSMEYTEAFKLMFIAGLFAFGVRFMLSFAQIDSVAVALGLPVLVNFGVVTFVLIRWEGLNFGQAAAVGAITSVFLLLLMIAITMVVVGAVAGAGAGAGP
jgi:hypothetical protein